MTKTNALILPPREKKIYRCLACGTTENMGRRKYCSADCRQRLKVRLEARTGLFQTLSTRYATFAFTDTFILLDLLLYGSPEIYSFIFPRTPGRKPAVDFSALADLLGQIWWEEKRRVGKRHLASEKVLTHAARNRVPAASVKPAVLSVFNVKNHSLVHLKIDRSHLWSKDLKLVIKNAYRQQAKTAHPDLGGDAETFRRVQQAYEDLLAWSENPLMIRRRGFPDKWFYNGESNKWLQPIRL